MRFLVAAMLAASLLAGPGAGNARAQAPSYRILRVEAPATHPHSGRHGPVYLDIVPDQPARPYAYGWFGAAPRRHWSRHFGTYRDFTQWSAK